MFPFHAGTGCEAPRRCLVSRMRIEREVGGGVSTRTAGFLNGVVWEHVVICVVVLILQKMRMDKKIPVI